MIADRCTPLTPHTLSTTSGTQKDGGSVAPSSRALAMRRAIEQIEHYAAFEHALVLLEGESGVGKTTLAAHLHTVSPRTRESFHTLDLGTVDETLAGSALFGHVSGAYTDARQQRPGAFVSAHRGTLFLDEIDKTSRLVQQRLLRAIERAEIMPLGSDRTIRVDVRIVVATNADLSALADAGTFLPDLLARIETFRVRIPALRERAADIPALVRHLVDRWAAACGHVTPPEVSDCLMACMRSYTWPRNLRELDGAVRRLLVDARGASRLTQAHWEAWRAECGRTQVPRPSTTPPRPAEIRAAIASAGSVSAAARQLGIARSSLYRHLRVEGHPE